MNEVIVGVTLVIAVAPIVMISVLRARNVAGLSPVELGVVFAVVVALYAVVPLMGFIASGFVFDLNLDSRSQELSLAAEDILRVAVLYLMFLLGFCSVYALGRPLRRGFVPGDVVCSDGRLPVVLVVVALFFVAAPTMIKTWLGIESSEDYIGTYIEMEGAALWVRQVYGLTSVMAITLVIAAIVSALAYRRQLVAVAAGVALLLGILAVASGGSRMLAMATLLTVIVAYAMVIRPISILQAALLGGLLVGAFAFAQLLRDFDNEGSVSTIASLLVNGEFASLFVNGLDMDQRKEWLERSEMLPNFYLVDMVRLIPQQLVPFEKIEPGKWYVSTLYPGYAEKGGGLAFGAIAESAVGLGAAEALIRGMLLGALFSFVQRLVSRPKSRTLVSLIAYVWLVIFCYQSFRDTTFSIVARFFYHAAPALLLVYVVDGTLRRLQHASRIRRIPSSNASGAPQRSV